MPINDFTLLGKVVYLQKLRYLILSKHMERIEDEILNAAKQGRRPNREAMKLLRLYQSIEENLSCITDDRLWSRIDNKRLDPTVLLNEVVKVLDSIHFENHAVTRWGQAGPDCKLVPGGAGRKAVA